MKPDFNPRSTERSLLDRESAGDAREIRHHGDDAEGGMGEMTERVPRWAWLVLRVCVGLPAIGSGIFNAINWDASNQFNSILLGGAAPVLTILGIAQILAGLLIITGYQLRVGVAIMLAFWIPATIRHFLAAQALVGDDPLVLVARRGQLSCVEKNVGLIGVMIFLFVADLRGRLTSGR